MLYANEVYILYINSLRYSVIMSADDTNIVLVYDYEPLCARLSSSWWKYLKRARQSPARHIPSAAATILLHKVVVQYVHTCWDFFPFIFFLSISRYVFPDVLCNGSLFDEVVLFPL